MNNTFEKKLVKLINEESLENGSNTPDFLLARYLVNCLRNYEEICKLKEPREIKIK